MVKGNISKIRNVLGVSVLALVLAPVVANAAEISTIKGGNVDGDQSITVSSNLASSYNIDNGNLSIIGDGSEDIVIDLKNNNITLETGSVSVGNSGKKVTIKNGNITCKRANSDCVTASDSLELIDVDITSNKGNALKVATAEIKNSNLTGAKALTMTGATTYENGVFKGTIDGIANLTVKGTVTGPVSLAEHADDNTKVIVDAVSTADVVVNVAGGKKGISVDFSKVDFNDTDYAYTISYNSQNVIVTGIPSIFREADDSTVGGMKKYQIKEADTSAFKKAVEEFNKAMENEDFANELAKKYTEEELDIANGLAADADQLDDKDVRSQGEVDKYTNYLNKMINKQDIDSSEVPSPSVPNDTNPDNPTDNTTGDDEPNENPQTFDALLSYVGMALASVGGIAVSLKKSLFR